MAVSVWKGQKHEKNLKSEKIRILGGLNKVIEQTMSQISSRIDPWISYCIEIINLKK